MSGSRPVTPSLARRTGVDTPALQAAIRKLFAVVEAVGRVALTVSTYGNAHARPVALPMPADAARTLRGYARDV